MVEETADKDLGNFKKYIFIGCRILYMRRSIAERSFTVNDIRIRTTLQSMPFAILIG